MLSEGSKSIAQRIQQQKAMVLAMMIACCCLNPWTMIPVFSYENEYGSLTNAGFLFTVLVATYFGGIVFFVLYFLKREFPSYGQCLVPGLIIYLWLFVYTPFLCLIPYLHMIIYGDEDYISAGQELWIAITCELVVVGIAVLFAFVEMYLTRYVYED